MKRKKIMNYAFLFLASICFYSCNWTNIGKHKCDTVSDSLSFDKIKNSSEHIMFSIFLLKYPDSKYFWEAIEKYNATREEYYNRVGWPVIDCFRNCANIKLRPNQDIIFEYQKIELNELKDSILSLLINEDYSELKPEKKELQDLNGITQEISKGHVELVYIEDSCQLLQSIVCEISEAYRLYEDYLAQKWYNKELCKIEKSKKEHIESLFEYRLHLYGFDKEYIPPPPPPIETETNILNIVDEEVVIDN